MAKPKKPSLFDKILIAGIIGVYSWIGGNLASDYVNRPAKIIKAVKQEEPTLESKINQYDSDTVILARAIFGEARGGSKELKIATAYTILNRVKDKRWPKKIKDVILQPYQISSFNKNDPNYNKVWKPEKYEPRAWKECINVAHDVLKGKYKDLSNGANHYCTKAVSPYWIKGKEPVKVIGNTRFYNLR